MVHWLVNSLLFWWPSSSDGAKSREKWFSANWFIFYIGCDSLCTLSWKVSWRQRNFSLNKWHPLIFTKISKLDNSWFSGVKRVKCWMSYTTKSQTLSGTADIGGKLKKDNMPLTWCHIVHTEVCQKNFVPCLVLRKRILNELLLVLFLSAHYFCYA